MENGKAVFNMDYEAQDYKTAVENFEKAAMLRPENAAAHYFLGYSYSRLNSKGGNSIPDMQTALVIKASEEFEKVISLNPHYTDEQVLLDPYSKITSEWNCLALKFKKENKIDSTLWAYQQGKIRGGFSEFALAYAKLNIDFCEKNAILFSIGDMSLASISYLQNVENFRNDVSFVDASLVNTDWYPRFLSENGIVAFNIDNAILDTIQFIEWHDSLISINNFTWLLKPNYNDKYLMKGDRVILSLLQANQFKRAIYFTLDFPAENQLSLTKFLNIDYPMSKLELNKEEETGLNNIITNLEKYLKIIKLADSNKDNDKDIITIIRIYLLNNAIYYSQEKESTKAIQLLKLMDQYIDENKFPIVDQEVKDIADKLRQNLKK